MAIDPRKTRTKHQDTVKEGQRRAFTCLWRTHTFVGGAWKRIRADDQSAMACALLRRPQRNGVFTRAVRLEEELEPDERAAIVIERETVFQVVGRRKVKRSERSLPFWGWDIRVDGRDEPLFAWESELLRHSCLDDEARS